VVALLALATCLPGCGTGGYMGVCEMDAMCIEYTGVGWGIDSITRRCEGFGGKYSSGDCPVEDLVGECVNDQGLEQEYIDYFYQPYWTAEQARSECANAGGLWRPAQ